MTHIPIHPGLRDLAARYDGFIMDLWGVLHDGLRAFPHAVACLGELRRCGKRIVILSNAPRRVASVIERNSEIGLPRELYDAALSSGEETWRHLKTRPDDWYRALGHRCHHIGPERDWGLREELDYDFVDSVADADFLLNSGASDPDDRVEDFDALLQSGLSRRLPMVCANPDLVVVRGGRREICAGAIAARYEEQGGQVRYHGKPAREVVERCVELLDLPDGAAVAMVGDSLRTDIAGARAGGVDGLFVTGGIHGEALGLADGEMPDPERLARFCAEAGERPAAALPLLRW